MEIVKLPSFGDPDSKNEETKSAKKQASNCHSRSKAVQGGPIKKLSLKKSQSVVLPLSSPEQYCGDADMREEPSFLGMISELE
jgi:hypothetical protein